MEIKNDFWKKPIVITPLIIIGIVILVVLCYFVWQSPQVYSQGMAVIISATLGAILTAIITRMVIKNQLENEQEKEKNVRIYRMKLDIYSDFVSEMWSKYGDDNNLDKEEIKQLRNILFSKLIFLLDGKEMSDLKDKFEELLKAIQGENDELVITEKLGEITQIIRNALDIDKEVAIDDKIKTTIARLWDAFAFENIQEETKSEQTAIKDNNTPITHNRRFWHMNMVNRDIQRESLKKGRNELSLIEYGEDKRTNILKQIEKGDIIFLYNKGRKFLGIFEAIGRRIFTQNEDGNVIEEYVEDLTYKDNEDKINVITDVNKVTEDLKEYDIYKGIEDGATHCSNLIVRPLACKLIDINGTNVSTIIPTICRYHIDFATIVLNLYKDAANDADFGKIDGVDIGCDTETFKSLFN